MREGPHVLSRLRCGLMCPQEVESQFVTTTLIGGELIDSWTTHSHTVEWPSTACTYYVISYVHNSNTTTASAAAPATTNC
jgi:hypothetical protein